MSNDKAKIANERETRPVTINHILFLLLRANIIKIVTQSGTWPLKRKNNRYKIIIDNK